MSRPTDTRPRRPPLIERPGAEDSPLVVAAPDEAEPEETTFDEVSSILSSVERAGDWLVADHTHARSLFGELKLDFTQADLPTDGIVEIRCFVLCGQLEIIVPEGSEVEMERVRVFVSEVKHGVARKRLRDFLWRAIEGGETEPSARSEGEPPLFVVTGRVIFGGINVVSR